jgi:hypothetical protein
MQSPTTSISVCIITTVLILESSRVPYQERNGIVRGAQELRLTALAFRLLRRYGPARHLLRAVALAPLRCEWWALKFLVLPNVHPAPRRGVHVRQCRLARIAGRVARGMVPRPRQGQAWGSLGDRDTRPGFRAAPQNFSLRTTFVRSWNGTAPYCTLAKSAAARSA